MSISVSYLLIKWHCYGRETNCSYQMKGNNCVLIHQNMAEANVIRADVELIGFEADCINAVSLLVRRTNH